MRPGLQRIRPAKIREYREAFTQALLVSGGRFLLTVSAPKLLQLWDIGFFWDSIPRWQSVASVQLRSDFFYEVLPARDGTGLHVILKDPGS
jgi:hypothetical protein